MATRKSKIACGASFVACIVFHVLCNNTYIGQGQPRASANYSLSVQEKQAAMSRTFLSFSLGTILSLLLNTVVTLKCVTRYLQIPTLQDLGKTCLSSWCAGLQRGLGLFAQRVQRLPTHQTSLLKFKTKRRLQVNKCQGRARRRLK